MLIFTTVKIGFKLFPTPSHQWTPLRIQMRIEEKNAMDTHSGPQVSDTSISF
jgi:hypothetical protein